MGTGPGGTTYQIGEMAGTEQETLTTQQIPNHDHAFLVSTNPANTNSPTGNVLGEQGTINLFLIDAPNQPMNAGSVTPAGGSQPHENTQPFLCINFIISLFGIYPSPT
jgi:microcystin-dependent protein